MGSVFHHGCWHFKCLLACHLSLLETNALFDWRPTVPGFLFLIGHKAGIPNLWHWFADTELFHNLCIWGGVVFLSLKIWAQFLWVWVLLPVFWASGASCQCSVNLYMCSKSNLLLFVHAAYLEKLKLPWVWGEEFSKAFVCNNFLLLLQAIIAVCLLCSSQPFLEWLLQRYY